MFVKWPPTSNRDIGLNTVANAGVLHKPVSHVTWHLRNKILKIVIKESMLQIYIISNVINQLQISSDFVNNFHNKKVIIYY